MKLQGGIDMNRTPFTEDVQEVAIELMAHVRLAVKLPHDAERGTRFNDDKMILLRLESMFSEEDFIKEPINTIVAALIEAAKADAWYSQEKEYDTHQDCDDDYESESDAC